MTDQQKAAPAPSSLAGGEVNPLVKRLAYGYAIMHTTICHMAGTSGASGRWYYDKANEAFGRVSPIHSITEDSNPHVNGDYFSGLSSFLAALSPEAPAREGVSEGELRDALGLILPLAKGYAAAHPVGSNRSYVDYVEGLIALTPRHGAPAEPCFECGSTERIGTACKPCNPELHEAPAEGAGEREAIRAVVRRHIEDRYYIDNLVDELLAIRARSSAPEAREAVARVVSAHGDPEAFGEREIEVLTDLSRIPYNTPLYTHPAAPSADKLRIAVEALDRAVVVRAFCASDPLSYRLEFANEEDRLAAADAIDQALAAMKAEGAK